MIVRAAETYLPTGLATDVTVELDGPRITRVRPSRAGDPPPLDGVLIPGLVNAHTHVGLTGLAGQVPATGLGFPEWATRLRALGTPPNAAAAGARALAAAGVAAVGDVGTGGSADALTAAGLTGIAWREYLGFDAERWPAAAAEARALDDRVGAFRVRACAHAIYSTPPGLLEAALRPGAAPTTIHLAEDPDETAFLTGEGPWPRLLDGLGLTWRWWAPPGGTPTAYLARLGLLRPDILLVHAVHLTHADRTAIADSGATVVLCPRSNLHIGGRLPDVSALLAAGIPLAIGTDSLASSSSLDPLDDLAALADALPAVDPAVWLRAATAGGADALRMPHHGRIVEGATPGLVLLEGSREIPRGPVARRWLVPTAPAW